MTTYNCKDVAKILNVCPHTIYRYVKQGIIKAITPNKYTKIITQEALDEFLSKTNKSE